MARADPWLAIADPVDDAPAAPTATAPPVTAAAPAKPAAPDAFAAVADPVDPVTLVDNTETVGVWGDQMPDETKARLDPEDEAYLLDLIKNKHDDEAIRFAASKGFELPEADFKKVIAHRDTHGVVGTAMDYLKPVPADDDGAVGAFARGVADVPTFGFMDELHGLAQGVKRAVTGQQSEQGFWHDVHVADDVYSGRVDRDEEEHPLARISGQLLGGLAIPVSYEGIGLRAGTLAMKEAKAAGSITTQEALKIGRKAAARAVTKAMARDGAVIGGVHGVGTGEGVGGRIGEGLTEAALGAAGGAAVGGVGELVAPRIVAKAAAARAAPLTEEQEIAAAAKRQDIDILPADVAGPVVRRATSWAGQTIAGGQPIIAASEKMHGQAQAARDRVAAAIGHALEPEAAGQQAISGAKQAIRTTADDARLFYSQAEKLTVGDRLEAPKAVAVLDKHIAELAETPGGAPGVATLRQLRDDLAKGNLSVSGIRRMRTVLRDQFIKEGLTGSDLQRRVNMVVDAAADDVTTGLKARGNAHAAELFAKGDAAWRKRASLIDDVIEPIIGKDGTKSGEAVIKTLTADLQGNNARAVKFLNSLPESERANVRASIIGALGKAKAGKQGSEGENFSLDTFLTNWNQVGKSARAAYFGPEANAALSDLAKIAEGTREAQGYRNFSNTGGVIGNGVTALTALAGVLPFIKVVGSQYAIGRMLASPRFARWLARAPTAKAAKIAYAQKLSGIAKAEPAIASDVLSLQSRLLEALNDNVARPLAASGTDNEQDGQ